MITESVAPKDASTKGWTETGPVSHIYAGTATEANFIAETANLLKDKTSRRVRHFVMI